MTLERDHDRTHAPATPTTADSDLAPGRSNRSNQLASPERPLVSALILRKARDANGVAEAADQSVATASTSTGHALPGTLMRKFESSLGADLSSVRVHTGSESHVAADAVGAKAYAVGNDIHFGAGHYDPTTHAGQHLIAHEVAHTVQQSGSVGRKPMFKLEVSQPSDGFETEADQAADAMLGGESFSLGTGAGLMRDNDPKAHSGASMTPPDMTSVDWRAGGAIPGPDLPKAITIPIAEVAPLPQGVTSDPRWGNQKAGNGFDSILDPRPHYPMTVFDLRENVWNGFKGSVHSIESIYNAAVPSITTFDDAAKSPALKDLYEFQQDGQSGENMHQVANKQVVPRTGSQTVGGQFQQIAGVSVGTDANTKGLDDNINRAAKSGKVEQAITVLRGKEAALAGSVHGMSQAQSEASAASHFAAAGKLGVDQADALEKEENGAAKKKDLEDKAATIVKYVDGAIKIVGFVAGMIAGPGAAAAGGLIMIGDQVGAYKPTDPNPPSGTQAAAGAVAKGADSSIVSTVAEKIVNYIYQSDIDAQTANIKAATAAYRTARGSAAKETWLGDCDMLAAKLAAVSKAADDMKSKLMDRKSAYQALADAAATAGGGSQQDQDRMRALILAIPVAKAVVAQSSNVLNVVNNETPYNEALGMAFHMAMAAHQQVATDVVTYNGQILGYRDQFKQHFDFWSKRVTSLEGVIGKLEGK